MPKFHNPLPEDRLSEKERDERIGVLDEFSKKLKKERKRAGIDDRTAIRQLLIYVGKRLDLLDVENRRARALAQYDSLLGRTTKPVPQGLIGVAADAVLDFGLKDREKMIRSHEEDTEPLIAEISLLAPEIDKLLDQRPSPDKENYVLRPSSCLPEVAVMDEDASSKSGSAPELPRNDGPQADTGEQNVEEDDLVGTTPAEIDRDENRSNGPNGKASKPSPTPQQKDRDFDKAWLNQRKPRIMVRGKPYNRNHLADPLMQRDYFTEPQLDVAVLWLGYEMRDTAIAELLGRSRKTVYDHRKAARALIAEDHAMRILLKNFKV